MKAILITLNVILISSIGALAFQWPVGIATQNPSLTAGLVVAEKAARMTPYHKETIEAPLVRTEGQPTVAQPLGT